MIILKILLYVILAVLCTAGTALVLALCLPATADVSFIDGKLKYKVNFSFVKLLDTDGKGLIKYIRKKKKSKHDDLSDDYDMYEDFPEDDDDIDDIIGYDDIDDIDIDTEIHAEPREDNVSSEKKRNIKKKKSGKPENDSPDEEEHKTIIDKIDFLLDIWDTGGRPLLKVFRGFRIKNVFIDFIVADEDAYRCAVNYGNVCNIVYNGLAWLGEIFTLSYRTVDIQCGFSLKKSQWNASCKVSFRIYHLVISGLWFLMTYIFKIFIPEKCKRKK